MISDLVLSICSVVGGTVRMNRVRHQSWRFSALAWFGMFGFSFVGFAAFLGFLRYGYFFQRRQHSISDYHRYFSDLASIIGMPMLAAAYTQRTEWQNLCWLFLVLAIISTLLHCIESLHTAVRAFCSSVSIFFILFACIFMEYRGLLNRSGFAGCICLIFAGVVSDQGRGILGFKNIDVFHYLLATAFILLSEGLLW